MTELFAARPFAGLFICSVSGGVPVHRVLVMSGRPGTIVEEFEVPFPLPHRPNCDSGPIQRTRRPGVGSVTRGTHDHTLIRLPRHEDPVEPDPGARRPPPISSVLAQKVKPAAGAVKKMAGPFAVFLLVLVPGTWSVTAFSTPTGATDAAAAQVITDGLLGDQADG